MNEVSGRGYKSSDIMPFGEYKDQTLASVYASNPAYIRQLEKSDEYFKVDWNSIFTQGKPPVKKPFCLKSKDTTVDELYDVISDEIDSIYEPNAVTKAAIAEDMFNDDDRR